MLVSEMIPRLTFRGGFLADRRLWLMPEIDGEAADAECLKEVVWYDAPNEFTVEGGLSETLFEAPSTVKVAHVVEAVQDVFTKGHLTDEIGETFLVSLEETETYRLKIIVSQVMSKDELH